MSIDRIRSHSPWRRLAALVWLVGLGILAATAASADESKAWDQAKVMKLAGLLVGALDGLEEGSKTVTPQDTAMQQRTRDAAVSQLSGLREAAREYADRLGEGWGLEQTRSYFEQIRDGFRQATELAGDAQAKGDQKVALQNIRVLLRDLERYYGAE